MSTPLKATPALRRAVSTTVRNVIVVAVVIAVLTALVAYFAGGIESTLAALIGGGIGIVLALVTWMTMSLAMKNLDNQSIFMVTDYLFKAIVVIATVLVVKNFGSLDHKALGLALIISVIAQAVTQTWTLAKSKVPTVDLNAEGKNQ